MRDQRHLFAAFRWNGCLINAVERFFLVRTAQFPVLTIGMEPAEAAEASEHRWWSVEELAASRETFAPTRLAELLPPLIQGELPKLPIDTGP